MADGRPAFDLHGPAIRARIARWRDDGLIDDVTAERLLAHEAAGGTQFGGALSMIGAISVALGVMAVVAANWDAIPIWLRLSVHVAGNFALGVWLYRLFTRSGGVAGWAGEALVIVLSASTLALIAHAGQSFQLQGDEFGLLATWLALTTPFTLAFGRSAAVRWLWTCGLGAVVLLGVDKYADWLLEAGLLGASGAALVVAGYAAPLALGFNAGLAPWGVHTRRLALAALVLTASGAQIIWRFHIRAAELAQIQGETLTAAAVAVAGLLIACVIAARQGRGLPWGATLFVIASPAYAALPVLAGGGNSALLAASGFCLYWLAVAFLTNAAGLIGWYRFAVVVVALRLFVVFVEAWGGLLLTGGGLIITGLLLLGLGYGVRRLLQRTVGKP